VPLTACHDCGRPTTGRWCAACRAAHKATDGAGRQAGRDYRGTALFRRLREQAWADHDGICGRCGQPIAPDEPWDLGHIVPHADGGRLERTNVRPEHRHCNRGNRRETRNAAARRMEGPGGGLIHHGDAADALLGAALAVRKTAEKSPGGHR